MKVNFKINTLRGIFLFPLERKKDAKRNDYLLSSSIITKLATGLKRWQSLKYHAHAKDYAIKPLHYLLRFLLRSFSPYGWLPFKA